MKNMVEAKAEALRLIEQAREAVDRVIEIARDDRWTIIEHAEAVDVRDLLSTAFMKINEVRDAPKPRDPNLVP